MIGLLTLCFSFLGFRFLRLRPVLDAKPLIVLQDGKPVEANLRRERLTLEELAAEARQQQSGSLTDVRWAGLEGNGRVSFVTKSGS